MKSWNAIPEIFSCLKKLVKAILLIFWPCRSFVSEMYLKKTVPEDRITDKYSSECGLLKMAKYEPDIKQWVSNVQQQKSVQCFYEIKC